MSTRTTLTKTLAVLGTIFSWLPLLAPLVFSLRGLIRPGGGVHFDYLMPAELFPLAWLGGGLLIWAAIRVRRRIQPIAISGSLMVVLWLSANGIAIETGLASGRAEPTGLVWILLIICLALFTLSVLSTAVLGILLLRDLFKPAPVPQPSDFPHAQE